MVAKENLRVGSIVKVLATGSGRPYNGKVVKLYPDYAVVEYKTRPNPLKNFEVTTLTESYQYFDILEVKKE